MSGPPQAPTEGGELATSFWGEKTVTSSSLTSVNWTRRRRSLFSLGFTIRVGRGPFLTTIRRLGVSTSGWWDAALFSFVLQNAELKTLPQLWSAKLSSVAAGSMWARLMTTQPELPSCLLEGEWLQKSVLEELDWLQIIP